MTVGQLELPLFPRQGCQVLSAGRCCRYYTGHSGDHTFGGGMGDPVHLRHCTQRQQHPAHAWDEYACSGRELP